LRDNEDFDILIDSALATYADVEESPALAARVLAVVRQNQNRRSFRRWLPWAIAIPAAAGLLVAVLFGMRSTPLHKQPPVSQVVAPPPLSGEVATAHAPSPVLRGMPSHRRRAANEVRPANHTPPLPKREVFPTPEPLSREEQVLVYLAVRSPAVSAQVVDAKPHSVEPLGIAAIHIPSLNPPDHGGN
jgi:hypothetical protein